MTKRGKGKVEVHYGRADMYKYYTEEIKGKPEMYQVSYSDYTKVLNKFNKDISKAIMEDAYEYILPKRLGTIRIKKYKPKLKLDEEGNLKTKYLPVNWKATNDLWASNPEAKASKKRVYHLNNHSDGYRYIWYYSTYRSNLPNKSLYRFIPTRTNKRELSALIKDSNFKGDYYE
jgi:hypothetical protein